MPPCEWFHHGGVSTSPDLTPSTTWQRVLSCPHAEERLVQRFRTQPLTPIKEVTIETGQSGCDRPNSGAGRSVWNPIAALASTYKVIHSLRCRPLACTITNNNSRDVDATTKTQTCGAGAAQRRRRTPPNLARGLLGNPSCSKRAQSVPAQMGAADYGSLLSPHESQQLDAEIAPPR